MHKIDRLALVQRFRYGQWRGLTHRQPLFALTAKIQLQQTINTMDPFVIPQVSLPPQNLEKFWKTVSWVITRNMKNFEPDCPGLIEH